MYMPKFQVKCELDVEKVALGIQNLQYFSNVGNTI